MPPLTAISSAQMLQSPFREPALRLAMHFRDSCVVRACLRGTAACVGLIRTRPVVRPRKSLTKLDLRLPAQDTLRERDVGSPAGRIVRGKRCEHAFRGAIGEPTHTSA